MFLEMLLKSLKIWDDKYEINEFKHCFIGKYFESINGLNDCISHEFGCMVNFESDYNVSHFNIIRNDLIVQTLLEESVIITKIGHALISINFDDKIEADEFPILDETFNCSFLSKSLLNSIKMHIELNVKNNVKSVFALLNFVTRLFINFRQSNNFATTATLTNYLGRNTKFNFASHLYPIKEHCENLAELKHIIERSFQSFGPQFLISITYSKNQYFEWKNSLIFNYKIVSTVMQKNPLDDIFSRVKTFHFEKELRLILRSYQISDDEDTV